MFTRHTGQTLKVVLLGALVALSLQPRCFSDEPKKEELVEQLISKGDAAAKKGDQQSAYWAYRFASVYAPADASIGKKISALGKLQTTETNAEISQMKPAIESFPSIAVVGFRDSRDPGEQDVKELQILLDSKLVGDLRTSGTSDGKNGVKARVFRRRPQMTHQELAKKHGRASIVASSDNVYYVLRYGRLRIVEANNKVIGVFYPEFDETK